MELDERLRDLYRIPDGILPQDLYLLDLSEQCARLELRVRSIAQALPAKQRQVIEAYLEIRDEMEFQSVKVAVEFAKRSQ